MMLPWSGVGEDSFNVRSDQYKHCTSCCFAVYSITAPINGFKVVLTELGGPVVATKL